MWLAELRGHVVPEAAVHDLRQNARVAVHDSIGAMKRQSAMRSISDAPQDGTPVLVKIKDDLAPWEIKPGHFGGTKRFAGLHAVMRCRGDMMDWCFVAPLGCGGLPAECLDGWWPL
ncbi:hypothetical protein [Salipiger mangrovisoli]|uniref:Uncharacterized protein n=1 Tax=Salipiger mangrovisoli TaxID=2865933 RepID=A0ABR9WWW9_9RHOB|nr:hypothetical protein [Salipiger mangrovisoli]MBE9635802.1 hypothetical protein [Salipiger mangrovisoli]